MTEKANPHCDCNAAVKHTQSGTIVCLGCGGKWRRNDGKRID